MCSPNDYDRRRFLGESIAEGNELLMDQIPLQREVLVCAL